MALLLLTVFGSAVGLSQPAGADPAAESASGCAFAPYGDIGAKWQSIGGEWGFYGCPTMDEAWTTDGRGGRYQYFHGGLIIWHPSTGAHLIYGAIHQAFVNRGREAGVGYPINDEYSIGGNGCRQQDFETDSIPWCP